MTTALNTTTESDVHAFIGSADKDAMDRIIASLNARSRSIAAITAMQNAATLKVGTAVTLQNLKPAKLNGLQGTVTSLDGKTATVTLDAASTHTLAWSRTNFAREARAMTLTDTGYSLHGVPMSAIKAS